MSLVPPWMAHAQGELGTEEVPGPGDNPRIVEYHMACDDTVTDDEVAWCSSFVNWCMMQSGIERTRSRAARSWMGWGSGLLVPCYGCVGVIWREAIDSWKGHVGFVVDQTDSHIVMLGGNQGNEVSVRRYAKGRLLGYRMPS